MEIRKALRHRHVSVEAFKHLKSFKVLNREKVVSLKLLSEPVRINNFMTFFDSTASNF